MSPRLFAAALVAFCTSCVSIQEPLTQTVVRQANANPLHGQTAFHVSLTFQRLSIGDKSEVDYLSELSEGTQNSFQLDKGQLQKAFSHALDEDKGDLSVDGAQSRGHLVTVNVDFIEPGVSVDRIETRVHATLRIFAPRGQLLDEVELESCQRLGPGAVSRGERLRGAGSQFGSATAAYLRKRTGF